MRFKPCRAHAKQFGPYFIKMVLTYGFLVLVAVLFSSMVLSIFSRIYLRSEITESNSRLLNQVRIFFDYSLIRTVKGLIASRLLGGSEDLPPLNIDTGRVPPDAFTLYQLSRSLRAFSYLSPFITSALVYYPGADTVITSEHGAFIGVGSQGTGVQRMPFYPIYRGLKDNLSGSGWLIEGMLCYFQALPLFKAEDQKTVYLAVSLDTARIQAEIKRITGSPDIVAAAAGPGGIFFSVGEDRPVFPEAGTGESGFMVIDSGGKRFGVSWVRSSEEEWTYYLKIPFDIINRRVTGIGRISVILLAVVLMFAFAAVAYTTTRLYRPLRSIVDVVTKQAGIGGKSGNELVLIEEAFSDLTSRVAEMDRALAENRPLIIHKSIIDIIFGYTEGHAGIAEKLSLAGLVGRAFRVAIIALDPGPYEDFSAEMKEFVILRFSEAVRSSVGESSRLIWYAPWCLVLIAPSRINLGEDRLGPFTRIDLEGFSLNANAAEEDEPVAAEDIHSTFKALQDVERYGGVYGYGLYLKGSEIRRNEASGGNVDPSRLAYLKGLLWGGNYAEFLTGLSEDLGRFQRGGYACDYIETYLYEVSSLMRGLRDSVEKVRDLELPKADLRTVSLGRYWETVAEFIRCLETAREQGLPLKDREFITRVCVYLEESVDANTSLAGLAERFGVSVGHLSRLFKKAKGVNFQDYLVEVKLVRACSLLKNTSMTVDGIAKSLGYHNTSYFTNMFRRRYGLTPLQYRLHGAGVAKNRTIPLGRM